MYKLLIADDEPLVLVGLKSMINWADFNIEICGTARNGKQALEIIENERPQIVIADIKMPVKTGLEVMQECREKYGNEQQFIILTSYEEREYLRTAITLSAVEYLIKVELTSQILSKAISKAISLISTQTQNPSEKKDKQSFREKFYIRLLNNLFENKETFLRQKNELSINLPWTYFTICYCEMSSLNDKNDADKQKQINLYNGAVQMVQETCNRFCHCYVTSLDLRHFAIIFGFDTDKNIKETINSSFEKTAVIIHNYFSVALSASVGSTVNDLYLLSLSFFTARGTFSLKQENQNIIFYDELCESQKYFREFDGLTYKNQIIKAFKELNSTLLQQTIQNICNYLDEHPYLTVQATDIAGMILYTSISLVPGGENTINQIFADESDSYRCLYQKHTCNSIKNWLLKLSDGLCNAIEECKNNYKTRNFIKIKEYIKENINKKITLNETAAIFNISANYLGQQFAKFSSCSFSEYVNHEKIEKAKALILKNDLKIYEIAEQLGFESAFYFSKVFKKQTGISPREYLEKH